MAKTVTRDRIGTRINLSSGLLETKSQVASVDSLVTSVNGYPSDHPFDVRHLDNSGCIISGRLGAARFIDWIAGDMPKTPVVSSLGNPRATATTLIAATNPSRPSMLLPVFWIELKDLPDMLRQVGRIAKRIYFERGTWSNLIRPQHFDRDVAAANLAIQFGWQPFVSDIWKIATMQDQVDRRRKELQKLYSGKGLSRRINFGTVSTTTMGTSTASSDLSANISRPYMRSEKVTSWGTIRWKPSAMPPWRPTDGELRRQLTGVSADAILLNLWEGLPWSWLVDWFIPIGQTIQGGNRTLAIPSSVCLMHTRETTINYMSRTYYNYPADPCTISAGRSHSVVKQRTVNGVIPPGTSASIPLLGSNQLSILASLAVLRVRR